MAQVFSGVPMRDVIARVDLELVPHIEVVRPGSCKNGLVPLPRLHTISKVREAPGTNDMVRTSSVFAGSAVLINPG